MNIKQAMLVADLLAWALWRLGWGSRTRHWRDRDDWLLLRRLLQLLWLGRERMLLLHLLLLLWMRLRGLCWLSSLSLDWVSLARVALGWLQLQSM